MAADINFKMESITNRMIIIVCNEIRHGDQFNEKR